MCINKSSSNSPNFRSRQSSDDTIQLHFTALRNLPAFELLYEVWRFTHGFLRALRWSQSRFLTRRLRLRLLRLLRVSTVLHGLLHLLVEQDRSFSIFCINGVRSAIKLGFVLASAPVGFGSTRPYALGAVGFKQRRKLFYEISCFVEELLLGLGLQAVWSVSLRSFEIHRRFPSTSDVPDRIILDGSLDCLSFWNDLCFWSGFVGRKIIEAHWWMRVGSLLTFLRIAADGFAGQIHALVQFLLAQEGRQVQELWLCFPTGVVCFLLERPVHQAARGVYAAGFTVSVMSSGLGQVTLTQKLR